MLITPDLSESNSEPVAPGVYTVRIANVEARESKAGKPYLNWRLDIFGETKHAGRALWYMTQTSGPGAFRLANLVRAAVGKSLASGEAFDTDTVLGREVRVTAVESRDQDGNIRQSPDIKTVSAL